MMNHKNVNQNNVNRCIIDNDSLLMSYTIHMCYIIWIYNLKYILIKVLNTKKKKIQLQVTSDRYEFT